jgi:hypothetical protein
MFELLVDKLLISPLALSQEFRVKQQLLESGVGLVNEAVYV